MTQKSNKMKQQKSKVPRNGVVRHSILGQTQSPSRTQMKMTPIPGGIRLKNQEVFKNVLGKIAATRYSYAMSPHNFPWMKSIGAGFAHYKFKKLRVWYRPLSSTTNPGVAYFGIFRDHSDASHWGAGGTGSDLLVNRESLAVPSWGGAGQLYFDIDCSVSRLNRYFTYTTESIPGDKVSDAFEFTLCVYAQDISSASDNHLGNLEIEYEVEFTTPVASSYNV